MLKWLGLGLALLMLALVSLGVYVSSVVGRGECDSRTVGESLSPDGQYKALIVQRACGFGSGSTTQVSVLRASENALPNQPGSTLVFQGEDVAVVWMDRDAITIAGAGARATYTVRVIRNKVTLSLKP